MDRFSLPRWSWLALMAVATVAVAVVVFRIGNQASAGVTLNDPVVWMEDGARGRVLQINGATEEVTAAVRVGDNGDSLSVLPRGQDAVFLNRTSGEVGVIGAVSLSVDNSDALEADNLPMTGESLQMLADFDRGVDAFIISSSRVVVVEPGAGQRNEIRTGDGLGDLAIDAQGRLLAVTPSGDAVLASGTQGLVSHAELAPPLDDDAQLPGLARSGDSTYVVDAGRRTVNEIADNGALGATTCVAGSLSGVKIAGNHLSASDGTHRVLVHDTAAGILSVSIPSTSDCLQIPIDARGEPESWGAPVAVDHLAYLPDYSTGRIHVVDMVEQAVLDTLRFGTAGRPFELEVFDGAVWANEPQGPFAAVLRGDSIRRISKISTIRVNEDGDGEGAGFQTVTADEDDGERLFGREGELGFGRDIGEEVGSGGDAASTPDAEGDPDESDGTDGEDFFDDEIANAPIIVDTEPVAPEDQLIDELIANFEFSAATVNVGETVEFTDTSTGAPTSWNWDFGDGTGAQGPEVEKVWDAEGVYTVTLRVANESGAEASQSFDFTVIAPDVLRVPTADFSFRTATVEVGETLEFVDRSTGEPDLLLWSFGDGSTDTGSVVRHAFAAPGQYSVTLTASNDAGPNTTSATITVIEAVRPPEAIIGTFPGVVEVGQTVTLTSESTNSPTAVSWGFGDGRSALGTTVRQSWSTPGEYRIRLSVSNSAGADETFAPIIVEARVDPPVARFSESALEVVAGTRVNFSDQSLNNPTSISWEFGDGTVDRGANVSHTWDEPGQYTVTLTVQNEAGTDDIAKTVTILPEPVDPPVANFTFPTARVPVNDLVTFTDTSTGDPTQWQWTFGDGKRSTVQNPTHGFAQPGEYIVTLTAANGGGTSTVSKTIVVVDPPKASYSYTADELLVSFTDTSTGTPTGWAWDFGDGTTSTAQNPMKAYDAPGTYTVTLVADNAGGTSAVFSAKVTVLLRPVADFTVTTGGLTAQFANASTNAPTSWLWDFGDGTTSSSQNPAAHLYPSSGTYNVSLTVTNNAGTSTVSKAVTVEVAPPVAVINCSVVSAGVACDSAGTTGATTYAWSAPGAINSDGIAQPNSTHTYGASGSYTITLTVANGEGATDSASQTVTVTVPEPPEITGLTVLSNDDGVVRVSAIASNSPTSWSWSAPGATISDGSTSSPTFTYTAEGSQTITVTASNAVGTSSPDSVTVTIDLALEPVVTVSNGGQANGVISASATATNGPITSWNWGINNGGVVASGQGTQAATFSVPANGQYTVTVTGTNGDGLSDSDSFTIDVNTVVAPPPVVTVSNGGQANGVISASATATNGPITSWTWGINNGGAVASGQGTQAATFSVPANGQYTVTVIGTNGDGLSDSDSFTIDVNTVPAPPPVVTVSNGGQANGVISASATATNGPITSWTWAINNGGAVASGQGTQAATFSVPANGQYTVSVTAVNADGQSGSASFPITVDSVPVPPPTAGFTWSQLGNQNTVNITNTSNAQPGATFTYDFGGGSQTGGTAASPAVTYPGPGSYTVTLTVTDAGGSDSFTDTVVIP